MTLQDITEQKLLEQEVRDQRDRLEALLEGETAGYSDKNFEEGTVYLSPRFMSMLGYAEGEIGTAKEDIEALVHPEDAGAGQAVLDQHIASRGKQPYSVEKRYLRKDGSAIWVLTRGSVVEWGDNGKPLRMMAVHVDISYIKERELQVQRSADELRRFAFIAAHDLAQPMNTIENCLNLLQEDMPEELNDDQQELMGFMNASTRRMKDRIRGILDFARMQEETVAFDPVDLGAVVADCLADLDAQTTAVSAKVHVGDLPMVQGTDSLMAGMIQNVLSNALKYTRTDRNCEIWIDPEPAPDGMAAIRIADNGIGIAEKHRTKIFELFSRLHTEDEFEGTGLGLALSQRIATQLGGAITVADGVEGGSAFIITLKAHETEA